MNNYLRVAISYEQSYYLVNQNYKWLTALMIGPGGSGGSANSNTSTNTNYYGGGGGSGALLFFKIQLQPGDIITAYIGYYSYQYAYLEIYPSSGSEIYFYANGGKNGSSATTSANGTPGAGGTFELYLGGDGEYQYSRAFIIYQLTNGNPGSSTSNQGGTTPQITPINYPPISDIQNYISLTGAPGMSSILTPSEIPIAGAGGNGGIFNQSAPTPGVPGLIILIFEW